MKSHDQAPLIAHIVFRFDYGGLENGVANLVNALSGASQRHAVIALTEVTEFKDRLDHRVATYALGKQPGKDIAAYFRLYRLLRQLRPAVVHTRNIGTLDCSLVAWLARVPVRIHGEHGWDVSDPDGKRRKYRMLRRVFSPFVHQFVAVSDELKTWLIDVVGIPSRKVVRICNGVDTERFCPGEASGDSSLPGRIRNEDAVVIGSVSRFSAIKDPMNLVEAFARICRQDPQIRRRARLAMIGDGELRVAALAQLDAEGISDLAWLPGSRDDVADFLRGIDVFVLPSYREGISNTILEAMASGLPVVATDVGGNPELVIDGRTGSLVPPGDSEALAAALLPYLADEPLRQRRGRESRHRAVAEFSIRAMVNAYRNVYHDMLSRRGMQLCVE